MKEHINIPYHIAIIMDGNGRWGKLHKSSRVQGHIEGVNALDRIIIHCMKLGVKALTVYAFSTENWNRPSSEVNALMKLFKKYLIDNQKKLNDNDIRLIISGNREKLSNDLIKTMDATTNFLKDNKSFTLNICFNYGGRQEIVDAVNTILSENKYSKIDENIFKNYLYASDLDYPDLLIRTGGDTRISNFLLWQLAYTEFYFTNSLWPDFNEQKLEEAILSYSNRNRKFGGLNETTK